MLQNVWFNNQVDTNSTPKAFWQYWHCNRHICQNSFVCVTNIMHLIWGLTDNGSFVSTAEVNFLNWRN